MSYCLLVIGDGRDEIHERSWASAEANLPQWKHKVTIDDRDHSLGFAGAIQEGWRQVLETGAEYVFHLEADFLFSAHVPIDRMMGVLKRHPYLAQLCLKRQAWNDEEKAAGGIVECHPEDYEQRFDSGDIWTEHRCCFSTNPSLYPTALCRHGWPQEPQSEGLFTHDLLQDPQVRFAFWGRKHAPPMVEHIGERIGVGY